jgi:hypothetical protein
MIWNWLDQASLSGAEIFFFMRSTSSPWISSTHHVQAALTPSNERSTEGGILLANPRSLPSRYAAILNLYVSRKLSSVPRTFEFGFLLVDALYAGVVRDGSVGQSGAHSSGDTFLGWMGNFNGSFDEEFFLLLESERWGLRGALS